MAACRTLLTRFCAAATSLGPVSTEVSAMRNGLLPDPGPLQGPVGDERGQVLPGSLLGGLECSGGTVQDQAIVLLLPSSQTACR
jgi:hypothetical protein